MALAKAPELSLKVVGGKLDIDGAGAYPGLELLNFVFGTSSAELLPNDQEVKITRRAHDFARRLVWDPTFEELPSRREVLYDDVTEDALRHLLKCLQLPIPNSRKAPSWGRAHFFPYTRSLVHWDARIRNGKIQIQRSYLRGGGAMAFHVLRMDPDADRLARGRLGFQALLPDSADSALEEIAAVLAGHGASDPSPRDDEVEPSTRLFNDPLEDLYRDGTVSILEHSELSAVARLRALIVWTGFWLITAQHVRSSQHLGAPASFIVCDCSSKHPQLRRASQRCLRDLQGVVVSAAEAALDGDEFSRNQRNKIRGFFWSTAATIKLLNAWTGRRHFVLGLDVLEALVLAGTRHGSEMPFDEFVESWLFRKCRLVVGRSAAEKSGLLSSLDASIFEDNENALGSQMRAAGLLNEYSDATRMVSTQGLV